MLSTPVVALPNFTQRFIVETDAFGSGIGTILSQQGHPIAYISQPLSPKHRSCSAYEREMYAILFTVRKWGHYLQGRPFTIKTDHKSLKYLLEQKLNTPLQHTWLIKLAGYDFDIQYKKGADNKAADALSRLHEDNAELGAISTISTDLFQQIQESWYSDPYLRQKIATLQQSVATDSPYTWIKEQLRKKGKLVVGSSTPLQQQLIALFHNSAWGGHSGMHATIKCLRTVLNWRGLHKHVREFVRACPIC